MKTKPSRSAFLFVIAVCFALGLLSMHLAGKDKLEGESTALPLTPTLPTVPPPDQTTILLLGVNECQLPSPKLKSIWFATYRAPGEDITLLGIPTEVASPAHPNITLRDLFQFSLDVGVGDPFLDALHSLIPLSADVLLVLDETATIQMIDNAGGVSVSNTQLNGQEVIDTVNLFDNDDDMALATQVLMIDAMLRQAPELGPTSITDGITTILDEGHGYLSTSLNKLVMIILELFPIQADSIHIETYPMDKP